MFDRRNMSALESNDMGQYPVTEYYSNYIKSHPDATKQEILRAVCDAVGLPNLTYLRVVGDTPFDPRTILFATYSEGWNERYQTNQYYLIDPLIGECMTSDRVKLWSEIPRNDENTKLFFAEAAEYGIPDSGVLIPLDLTRPGCAVLSVNTNLTDEEWAQGQEEFIADLTRFGQLLHQSVLDEISDREYSMTLMPTEAELLKWIADGRSLKEISLVTSLSMDAIEADLDTVRKKLAANTNEEAAETAKLRKLIA